MTDHLSAAELLALIVDDAVFSPWDEDVVSTDPLEFRDTIPYAQRLTEAAQRSGTAESIIAGRARINGHEVVVIAGEFAFLAGTMGVATAERVVRAFDRASELRLPVVALPISGGTRMQEGAAAFIHMASCAAAVARFRAAGGLYVSYLRNPTTGGVLASWASLAHVRWAEPGALIGLTGPRVAREMTGEDFPEGVQVAENLVRHGVIDDVVPLDALRPRLAALLSCVVERQCDWPPAADAHLLPEDAAVEAWAAVEHSRDPGRPGVVELLEACGADEVTGLRGDGAGEDDPNCPVAVTRVCGISVVVVAMWRRPGERGASITAAGYRKARRGIELAGQLGLPLLTIIDTAGAAMTPHDEQSGLAGAIGGCLMALASTPSPTLSVLLGEGAGGGAIALLPADRVVAAQHSWLSPIAPEGASAILYRTAGRAADVASAQHIASTDLRSLGIVDVVVPDTAEDAPQVLAALIGLGLRDLVAQDPEQRLAARERRYRPAPS